jgi:plastocyanin
VKGDINGDGAVDVYDLQYLYEYCCDKNTITDPATLARLDVNGDGKQDIADAAALYGYLTEGQWPVPCHAITVKSTAPETAQVEQGGMYTLYMSDVFDTCPDSVTYTLSGEGLGKHTKLAADDKGDYLSFTNSKTGDYLLTITAVCGADSAVQAVYHLTVTVTKSAAGDPGQYDYDEENADSVTVYVTVSNDGVPIYGVDGTPIAHLEVEVPYFDLENQGLAEFYRYHTENGRGGGSYIDDVVVERPTVLHLYLYLLGVYCKGYTPEEVTSGTKKVVDGQSDRYREVYDILGKQTASWPGPALTISGSATSMYMPNFWGHDENLMYYRNHVYPLMGPGWGATADYILLSNGDTIDVALFSDWNFWSDGGAFTCFDKDEYTVKAGETLTFNTLKYETKSVADGGSESFQPVEGMTVKLYNEQWTELAEIAPAGSGDAFQYVVNEKPGTYYLLAVDPKAGSDAARLAPATARLRVS